MPYYQQSHFNDMYAVWLNGKCLATDLPLDEAQQMVAAYSPIDHPAALAANLPF